MGKRLALRAGPSGPQLEAVVDMVRDCVLVCVLPSRVVRGPDADQCHGLAVDGCGCVDGDSLLRPDFARRITANSELVRTRGIRLSN